MAKYGKLSYYKLIMIKVSRDFRNIFHSHPSPISVFFFPLVGENSPIFVLPFFPPPRKNSPTSKKFPNLEEILHKSSPFCCYIQSLSLQILMIYLHIISENKRKILADIAYCQQNLMTSNLTTRNQGSILPHSGDDSS